MKESQISRYFVIEEDYYIKLKVINRYLLKNIIFLELLELLFFSIYKIL